ncbi:hypothetical protein [uncultured Halorubrum sp.]|uniref:hypothetical protein n=1 Tax=uncultured Halorubrum sp. TaxID=399555 RepID=UPI00262AADD7|nr:hypothetical protein [uncultured Halorubrum sp.]
MALDVEILNVEDTGNTLEVAVSVSTETVETIDYEININDTGTGGTVTRSGTLVGGAGSFPGDAEIRDVSFGIGDTTGGTVTAQVTAPEEYVGVQDQVMWGEQGGSIGLTNCDVSQSNGDLTVSYTLAPSGDASGDTRVNIDVDGRSVASAVNFVPPRGGSFTQTIPADDLPVGTDMPVEIEVEGNFSECGTVTVEEDDPADGPVDDQEPPEPDPVAPSITDCSIENEDPLRVRLTVDGDGSRGSATASVRVGGFEVWTEAVNYTLNPVESVIEVPSDQLPTGRNMNVEVSLV